MSLLSRKNLSAILLICPMVLVALSCSKGQKSGSSGKMSAGELKTEDQKIIYSVGLSLSRYVEPFDLTEQEMTFLVMGMKDGILKNEKKVKPEDYQMKIQEFLTKRSNKTLKKEKAEGVAYLTKMTSEKGATKTKSGLIYTHILSGKGKTPKPQDTVKVHYVGKLRDGTVFDSSHKRGRPATFPLNRVIKCWTEGVQLMKVGGKSKLVCPSDIAYGKMGSRGIKPGAVLTFEVELLEIVKNDRPKPKKAGKRTKRKKKK